MADLLQILNKYRDSKVVIYGLGTETERVLNEIGQDFQIIGLLDGYREEGKLYGKPIISLQQAIECQVKLILVVARPGSCRAIVKRIGAICINNQVALIDVRGRDLCETKKVTYHFQGKDGISKEQFMRQIHENDVVSIDLFDTLIMRQTLFSTDIFEMVDCRLKEKGIVIRDFSKRRLESEKYLAKFAAPNLIEIYAHMKSTYSIAEIVPEELAQLEWMIDYDLVVPRQEMCDFMEEVHRQGKEIYIVSDTFYTKGQIIKLLEKCKIGFYTDIFASCEYKATKASDLFKKVKERVCDKKWIHIGDDIVADVESARRHGIAACQIYSGIDLLELVGYLGVWDSIKGLANRIKIGIFVSKIFNSPFQFEKGERKISIQNAYDLGYLLFAPIISDFVIWFEEQAEQYDLSNIWFCARDGYLIKKMYDELHGDTESIYFLTSRTAAIRAGIDSEEDIEYVSGMKFSGTIEEQLHERFGISRRDEAEYHNICNKSLIDYSDVILSKACIDRENYQRYIDKLHIKKGDIAFFDFVAKGTSQMYIQRLIDCHLKGIYFMQLEGEYMQGKGLDILSFYNRQETDHSEIYENYYILETILASPMPSIKEFDEHGDPCYAHETRKEEDIRCMQAAQDGVLDYFKTYLKLCPRPEVSVDKKLDELFLSLIHGITILDRDFVGLKVEDPFFNRMTDVADLV
ncbi:MAG: HAD hydrolase-like protein [Lachnospiraceae bacterium]|nr:HAD hydrolase-like protein [Lachnospiraceae bacterium]